MNLEIVTYVNDCPFSSLQSEKVNKEMYTDFGLSDATVDLLFCLIRDIFEGGKILCIGFVSMGDIGCT